MSLKRKLLFLYALVALSVALILSVSTSVVDKYNVWRDGVRVVATVVELNCNHHMLIMYRFERDGKTYVGSTTSPRCRVLESASNISVWSLRGNPEISLVGDPWRIFKDELISIVIATFAVPGLVVGVVFAASKKAKEGGVIFPTKRSQRAH